MVAVDILLVFLAGVIVNHIWGLQVIPERASVEYINEKYSSDAKFYVKRFRRRSNYYINLEGTTKHVWANNVSAHLLFYEYLHNEYKRSFVEMHFKFCDMMKSDPYVGKAVAATGITCPLPAGFHKLNNMSVPTQNFVSLWPFERCRVDIKIHQLPTEDLIYHLHLYLYFKQ